MIGWLQQQLSLSLEQSFEQFLRRWDRVQENNMGRPSLTTIGRRTVIFVFGDSNLPQAVKFESPREEQRTMTILSTHEKMRLLAALEVKISRAADCVNRAKSCLMACPSTAETERVAECAKKLTALQSTKEKLEQASVVDSDTIENDLPVKITRRGDKFYIGGMPAPMEFVAVK